MLPISYAVHIDAPPERVWRAAIDIERWPEWASHMKSLVRQDEGPFGVGSRARVTRKGLPGSIWTVTEYEEGTSYTWITTLAPGVQLVGGHVIDPAGGATNATFWLEATGPIGTLLSPALGLVFRRNTRLATQGLKAYCERSAT